MLQVSRAAVIACVVAGSTAHADSGDRWNAGTMAIQAGAGIGVGAGVGGAGGVIGLVAGSTIGKKGDWGAPLAGAAIGGTIGLLIGIPLGVHYGGSSRDATGSALGTTLGELGGFFTFGLLGTIADKKRWRVSKGVGLLAGTVCLIGGPIVGYQLTNDGPKTSQKIVPIVGLVF